jgi:hypothetical protein
LLIALGLRTTADRLVGRDADWAVVSFHTEPSDELIEERPDSSSKAGTKQMKYLEAEIN